MPDWIVKYWIEWIFGILAAILLALFRGLSKRVKDTQKKDNAIEKGMQALLRAQMVADYNHYADKGYAPIYAREAFEQCYVQYKDLGGNGVMTDIHEKFKALPTPKGERE